MAFFRRTEAELRAAPSETFTHDQIGVPGTSSQVVCTTCPSGSVPFVFTGVVTAQQVLDALSGAAGSAAAQRLALGRLQAQVRREQRRLGLPVDESGTFQQLTDRLSMLRAMSSPSSPTTTPAPAPAPTGGTPLAPSGGGVFAGAPAPSQQGQGTMPDVRASFITDIGRIAGGALGGLAAGGPIGGILGGIGALGGAGGQTTGGPAGTGTKFTGIPAAGDCFDRFGNRVPCPEQTTTTTDVGPFGGLFGGTTTTTEVITGMGGGAAGLPSVACPKGFRPNKSSYTLRDGTFVPRGSKCVRNRRLNPMNGAANRRAISRIKSAKRMQKELSRITIRKKSCG